MLVLDSAGRLFQAFDATRKTPRQTVQVSWKPRDNFRIIGWFSFYSPCNISMHLALLLIS